MEREDPRGPHPLQARAPRPRPGRRFCLRVRDRRARRAFDSVTRLCSRASPENSNAVSRPPMWSPSSMTFMEYEGAADPRFPSPAWMRACPRSTRTHPLWTTSACLARPRAGGADHDRLSSAAVVSFKTPAASAPLESGRDCRRACCTSLIRRLRLGSAPNCTRARDLRWLVVVDRGSDLVVPPGNSLTDSRAKIEHGKDAGFRRSSATSESEDAARRRFAAANRQRICGRCH